MNHAITMPLAFHAPMSTKRRPVLGWGISLLVHAVAIAWIWHATSPHPADLDARPAAAIAVRVRPIAPDVPPPAAAPRVVAPVSTGLPTRPLPRQRASAAAVPDTPARFSMPPEPASPIGAAGGAADTPTFDLAAARATARLVTREERKGVVALAGRQPVDESRADTRTRDRLERARRADCFKAHSESMNLLANVAFLARDMVANAVDGSGCKW